MSRKITNVSFQIFLFFCNNREIFSIFQFSFFALEWMTFKCIHGCFIFHCQISKDKHILLFFSSSSSAIYIFFHRFVSYLHFQFFLNVSFSSCFSFSSIFTIFPVLLFSLFAFLSVPYLSPFFPRVSFFSAHFLSFFTFLFSFVLVPGESAYKFTALYLSRILAASLNVSLVLCCCLST